MQLVTLDKENHEALQTLLSDPDARQKIETIVCFLAEFYDKLNGIVDIQTDGEDTSVFILLPFPTIDTQYFSDRVSQFMQNTLEQEETGDIALEIGLTTAEEFEEMLNDTFSVFELK